MNGRTIVIGDLQGCHQEALALLKKCGVTPSDRVIFSGDLIDRGPDNGLCVDLAMRREQIQGSESCILGNHEDRHLGYRAMEEHGQDPKCVIPTHVATRKQLTAAHYEYMRRMPLFIRLPEHNAVVVHAGVYPGLTIEEQQRHHLLHIQMIKPPAIESKWPSKCPPDWKFWTHYWDGPERIIFGHSVFDKPLMTDKVAGIDGGGCFGMQLHALILPEWEILSVQCKVNYGKGSRGRSKDTIKKILIHGDVSSFS